MNSIDRIKEIVNTIQDNRGKPVSESVDKSTLLRDDLGFDSLDLAELTVHLERDFGVDVFENGMVYTIEDVLEKLKE